MIGMGVGVTVRRWTRSARLGAPSTLQVLENTSPATRVAAAHSRAVSFVDGRTP